MNVLQGDVLVCLRGLPDESVHCCVTSPPYWGLRDYKVEGQIGLEPTPDIYVAKMVEVFREVRRVLRKNGTCWVNLGDSYAANWNSQRNEGGGGFKENGRTRNKYPPPNLKPKDLCGIPWRVALALQADGWWLRQDIIWHKPNPMPESVTDRCTKAHEYVFLLTKAERYWWDQKAIMELASTDDMRRPYGSPGANALDPRGKQGEGKPRQFSATVQEGTNRKDVGRTFVDNGIRNRRSVWTIASQPYPEAHFATFPEELPRLCILAGCPPGGIVLDPFAGSGTTGKVALELGRRTLLIELNPQYCELIRQRCAVTPGFVFTETMP